MIAVAHPLTAPPQHRPGGPQRTQPYVLVPDGLIEAHARDPLAVGVYVAVARLTLIRKGPVPLSATELAAWMGSDTEADRAAIMRRIVKLEQAGWLLVTRVSAHKHTLLPTWGPDRQGSVRPWDFDAPASGRPEHVRGRRVPLALLDTYLGQLKPQQGRGWPSSAAICVARCLISSTSAPTPSASAPSSRRPCASATWASPRTPCPPNGRYWSWRQVARSPPSSTTPRSPWA